MQYFESAHLQAMHRMVFSLQHLLQCLFQHFVILLQISSHGKIGLQTENAEYSELGIASRAFLSSVPHLVVGVLALV